MGSGVDEKTMVSVEASLSWNSVNYQVSPFLFGAETVVGDIPNLV